MLSKTQTFKLDMTTILFLLHATTYIHIFGRDGFKSGKSPIITIWMFLTQSETDYFANWIAKVSQ